MKELLLLEEELHAREVNLEGLPGICAGLHKPNGQIIKSSLVRRPDASSLASVLRVRPAGADLSAGRVAFRLPSPVRAGGRAR